MNLIKCKDSVMENNSSNLNQNGGIIKPDSNFNFSSLHLADPISVQGGTYFTKITTNDFPLYVQTPKCLTKQGFAKTGKKIFTDLVFNNHDEQFIQWLIDLESVCEDLIYQKSTEWFQNPLELDDIQSAFNSCVRIQKTGNYHVRSNVKLNSLTQDPLIRIYNESESILTMNDVIPQTNIIVILEIKGVKFTTRNFNLDVEMKQVMVLNKDLFENCLIKPSTQQIPVDSPIEGNLGKISTDLKSKKTNNIENIDNETLLDDVEKKNKKGIEMLVEQNDEYVDEIESVDSDNSNIDSDSDESDSSVVKLTLGELVTLDEIDSIEKEESSNDPEKIENIEIASANILSENNIDLVEKNENKEEQLEKITDNEKLEDDDKESLPKIETEKVDKLEESNNIQDKEKVLVDNILQDIKPILSTDLDEVNVEPIDSDEVIKLKQPSDYYYTLYKQVRETARKQKQTALENYMKAKHIKNTYLLDDISDTSDDINNIGSDIEESIELE